MNLYLTSNSDMYDCIDQYGCQQMIESTHKNGFSFKASVMTLLMLSSTPVPIK